MSVYYNEIEPYAVEWLRTLIAAGHLPAGDVDERPIQEVQPEDVRGYTQCHFFAGLGGWAYALRLAGWPDDRPVWTGSCPCQPFSAAGKRGGTTDARHLWPEWARLLTECRPPVVFGEQVASPLGRDWLATVRAEMEGLGYAVGAADLCAASVGAPHIRQRLWLGGWLADAKRGTAERHRHDLDGTTEADQGREEERKRLRADAGHGEPTGGLGHAHDQGSQGRHGRELPERAGECPVGAAGPSDPWADLEWLPCADGLWRPTQSGLFPLAHGVPGRVGRLRAYGNAIVPQVAATFIEAFRDVMR